MELTGLAPLLGARASATISDASVLSAAGPVVLSGDALTTGATRAEMADACATLRRMPAVTVLLGEPASAPTALVDAVDICLTSVADPPRPWVTAPLAAVADAIAAQPLASLALATLLRSTGSLPVWDALAAEASTYGMLLGSRAFRTWLDARPTVAPLVDANPVLLARAGSVLEVELNRPESRNAFDSGIRDALVEAFDLVRADPTIAACRLHGAGPCFSSGGDLREFGTLGDPARSVAVRLTRHPGGALADVADRVEAFIHGACIGAGIEVPAFARRVVAAPDLAARLPEVGMGLVPGAGGTVSLPRRIGRQRAAWLAITGEAVDADTALAWGLVDEVRARDRWPIG